jgi:hypothetical protein
MGPISTLRGTGVSLFEDRAWRSSFTSNSCRGYGYVMLCNHFDHSSSWRNTWTLRKFNADRIFCLLIFVLPYTCLSSLKRTSRTYTNWQSYFLAFLRYSLILTTFWHRLRQNVKNYYCGVFGRVAFKNHAPQCLAYTRHMKVTAVLSITSESKRKF